MFVIVDKNERQIIDCCKICEEKEKEKKAAIYIYSEIVIYNVHYESMIMAMSSLTFSVLVLKLREAQATINWYYQQDGVPIEYKASEEFQQGIYIFRCMHALHSFSEKG